MANQSITQQNKIKRKRIKMTNTLKLDSMLHTIVRSMACCTLFSVTVDRCIGPMPNMIYKHHSRIISMICKTNLNNLYYNLLNGLGIL